MRVVFMGTPDFGIPTLNALYEKHEVVGVVTQPDRPKGRGGKVLPPPIKVRATELGIPVFQFEKISREGVETLKELNPDIMVTAAYGQILSDEILSIAKHGVINVHGSILPKYRGSSPIQHAVLCGEKETGVTIMKTAREIDSGDIILVKTTPISDSDGTVALFDRLAVLGAEALIEAIEKIENGTATQTPQEHDKATFCKMLTKQDAVIDWLKSADEVSRVIRAFDYQGASTTIGGEFCKLFTPVVVEGQGEPGEIITIDEKIGLIVACGEKAVKINEILLPGGKKMNVKDCIRGRKIKEEFFGR